MTSRFPQKKAVMASGDTRSKSVTLIGAGKLSPKAVKGSGLDQDQQPIRFKFQPDESSAAIQELIGTLTRCLLKYCAGRTEIGYFLKAGRAAT